jgi:serine/threonine protein kinase
MSSLKKASSLKHLSLVKKTDAVTEVARKSVEVVSYEKLSLAQIGVLNSYLSITDSIGNCVGALVGLEDWDVRPLVIENNKLTITRFTQPETDDSDYKKFMSFGKTLQISSRLTLITGFGSTTDQLWLKRVFYQSTMKDRLGTMSQLSFSEKKQCCIQLANLLASLHQKKIVHGNISLSNIAWVDDKPILLDFGFAAISADSITNATLAPELNQGKDPTTATDIYGLGKVFMALIESIKNLPLAALINEMTHIDPEKRPDLNKVIDFFEDKKEDVPVNHEITQTNLLSPGMSTSKDKEVVIRLPKRKNIPWYAFGAFILFIVAAYIFARPNAPAPKGDKVYDQAEYAQLWRTEQPSMMQVVARAAIEKNDKIAQSVIVKDILATEDSSDSKQINADLIRAAFDSRWEASLSENDRKIILILATAGIFSNNMPEMPSLMDASPIVLLSLMGTLPTDTAIKDFLGISVEKLYNLPSPFEQVFQEYGKYRTVKLEDASLRGLAHIALGNYDDKMMETYFLPAKKEVDLFKMVRVIIPLFSLNKDLDSQLYAFLLTRSKIFAQAYRWFDEENFSDWNGVSRGDKIGIVSGIFPNKQLPFEKYADLLKHPNPKISKEAAQLINSKFYAGKMKTLLDYLASEKNHFTRYQTISILAALSLQGKEASDFYSKWFQGKPDVNSVLDFLVLRSESKANDIFNLSAAQYLADKQWTASHETLKKLVLHPETLARALAYSKLDTSNAEDLALLNSMSIAEPNPRLREQIKKRIGN